MLALTGCEPGLEGTWAGTDHLGEPLTLEFYADGEMELIGPQGPLSATLQGAPRLEYEVLNEVEPRQLSMVFVLGDTLRRRMPLGIYKFENRRLVICMAAASQPTLGAVPFGQLSFEWPTEFTGDCFALDRSD